MASIIIRRQPKRPHLSPAGTSFLVNERHILTGAHVVAAALGWPYDPDDSPIANMVSQDLP
jgi:hypothetical protein